MRQPEHQAADRRRKPAGFPTNSKSISPEQVELATRTRYEPVSYDVVAAGLSEYEKHFCHSKDKYF